VLLNSSRKVFGDSARLLLRELEPARFDEAVGHPVRFVQDNHSRSARRAARPALPACAQAQGKLVRCTYGEVFDVAVDLRAGLRPSAAGWAASERENFRQLWIPPGFGHGFLVLSETADFLYKTTDYYAPECEGVLRWDDPAVGIVWPDIGMLPQLADKDAAAPTLRELTPL
jgi:dTDP-4-dehydrorhamnose 3,5-epimerase